MRPACLRGREIEPADLVETIEAVARADGSTGWCVMIGATSGMVAAYLPDDEARAIYRSSDVVTGGVFAPRGTATPVEGGFRMNGRWAFASGSQHCAWLMGGCLVGGADGARGGDGAPDGAPDARLLLLPAGEVEILDTWTVAGLCGTGSHDMVVTDAFVPAGRAVSLVTEPPRQRGALYAFPLFGLLALGIAVVALGLGRAAVDELTDLAGVKVPTGSRRRLAQRSAVQADVARAECNHWFTTVYHNPNGADASGVHGTPEQVRARLEQLVAHGADHLLLNPVCRHAEQLEALAAIVGLS